MDRQQKALVIESLKESFSKSQASFLINYKGLTVEQLQSLRKELRQKSGSFKVAKARLIKRAVQDIEQAKVLEPYLNDQIGLVFASEEPPAVAKVLDEFSKNIESLRLVVGYLDSKLLESKDISRIANLPSKEVLLAQVCGTLKAPISGLAVALNQLVVQLLWVLKQIEEKKK